MTIKIPPTIRAAAGKYAREYATGLHGNPCMRTDENGEEYGVSGDDANPDWHQCYDDCKAAYLACYEKLMSGGPDGYVLLYPNGKMVESDNGLVTDIHQDLGALLKNEHYDTLTEAEKAESDYLTCLGKFSVSQLLKRGWAVKPVKIIKIDEEPKP